MDKQKRIENYPIIVKIVNRAEKGKMLLFDKISLAMDLECAVDEFNLRLNDLLNADDYNFAHDIYGIQHNLNRQTKKMENFFVPRFAVNS